MKCRTNVLITSDRITGDEATDIGFVSPTRTVMLKKKNVSIKLNTDQGEGIKDKLKSAAEQLSNKI